MIVALSPLMRKLGLITRFYGGIFFANFLVTVSCIGVYLLKDGRTHLTKTVQDLDNVEYVTL